MLRKTLLALLVAFPMCAAATDIPGGLTPVKSAAAEGSNVLCTPTSDGCKLRALTVTNGATAGYVLVFNATSAPADGAVTPVYCWAMPATNSTIGVDFTTPARFTTGITVVYSTTGCFTKTASATAFFSAEVKS